MDKKVLLARICDNTGAMRMMLEVRRRAPSPWLPVLTFHRVADIRPDHPFDDDVVDTTPRAFEQQMALLRACFDPISLDDLLAFVRGRPLPSNPVLVTFDDGYRDNVDVALPILRRHAIPAVFFVATDYVTKRRLFWWDRIAYVIKRAPGPVIALRYPRPLTLRLTTSRLRADAARVALQIVKRTADLDLDRFLGELTDAAGVLWSDAHERRCADELVMTWDQVRELRAAGMHVQSHTRTHRVLQTLRPAEVLAELEGSRRDLERELHERVFAVSYPVGHTIDDRPDVRSALRRAGYALGFTNATGAQPMWRGVDAYDLHRMCLAPHTPTSLFRAMLAVPPVFG